MYDVLKTIIQQGQRIVFFGGAGVSTESNIPDFRSQTGIFSKKPYPYSAEMMLSHEFFMTHTEAFFDFYKHEMIYEHAKPNAAHVALAKLEEEGKLSAVITQNIDGLHQKAGSHEVLELHGSVHRNYCMDCHTFYNLDAMIQLHEVPTCSNCGGIIKPDVVLYGEGLDQTIISKSIQYIANADVLIIGGTSLQVYPAAGLIQYFNGKALVLINKEHTPVDHKATLVIHDSIAEVLQQVI